MEAIVELDIRRRSRSGLSIVNRGQHKILAAPAGSTFNVPLVIYTLCSLQITEHSGMLLVINNTGGTEMFLLFNTHF